MKVFVILAMLCSCSVRHLQETSPFHTDAGAVDAALDLEVLDIGVPVVDATAGGEAQCPVCDKEDCDIDSALIKVVDWPGMTACHTRDQDDDDAQHRWSHGVRPLCHC